MSGRELRLVSVRNPMEVLGIYMSIPSISGLRGTFLHWLEYEEDSFASFAMDSLFIVGIFCSSFHERRREASIDCRVKYSSSELTIALFTIF